MPIRPTRTLQISFAPGTVAGSWTADDGTGDPFIGFPYQWNATITVTAQPTSDHATTPQYFFDGTNVLVGDWIATSAGGLALKIVSINSQDAGTVICVVEDADRYNTFADPTQSGSGSIPVGNGILFSLADDGLPLLSPVTTQILPYEFQSDITGRFRAHNQLNSFVEVNQPANTFVVGDAVYLDSTNTYQLVDSTHADSTIGFVTSIGVPGPGYFNYRPLGRIINNIAPVLPGTTGSLIYLDSANAGKYTASPPALNARAVFIQLNGAGSTGIQIERSTTVARSQTKSVKVTPTNGQTAFTMASEVKSVIEMSINGSENVNFTFAPPTLTFDPIATGYALDTTDEVIFVYTT